MSDDDTKSMKPKELRIEIIRLSIRLRVLKSRLKRVSDSSDEHY